MIDYKKVLSKYTTPMFIYDANELDNRINYLRSKLDYNLVYAIKANTFIAKEVEPLVDRFEICSEGEYRVCERLNIPRNKMVISGVNKDSLFIEELISKYNDVLIYTVESIKHYELLNTLSKKYKRNINILLRVTSGNQFGISEEDLYYILDNLDNKYITFKGIEYFSGTQKHSLKRIEKEITYLKELTTTIEEKYNINIEEIEYGPGLPVFYFQDDEFNEEEFLTEVNNILKLISDKVISLELGRSIASSCGSYLTSVVDLKNNKNGNFVILDGGINQLVYYGQTMAMRIPHYELIQSTPSKDTDTYNLCGSLCTINDILVKNLTTPKLNINDTFVFKYTGAYSITEGIALFLTRNLPKVLIINKNNDIIQVRDELNTSDINSPIYKGE